MRNLTLSNQSPAQGVRDTVQGEGGQNFCDDREACVLDAQAGVKFVLELPALPRRDRDTFVVETLQKQARRHETQVDDDDGSTRTSSRCGVSFHLYSLPFCAIK